MFIHSGTVETGQAQRKLWGIFACFSFSIYFSQTFLSSTASGSMWGLQLNCGFLSFFISFPSQTGGRKASSETKVLHSNRLGARGKYPPGKFSDGETPEGAEGEGVGGNVPPCLSFSLRHSPVPHDSCIQTQAAPCQGHTEGRGQTEARKMARGPVWSVLQWEQESWGIENRIQRSVF